MFIDILCVLCSHNLYLTSGALTPTLTEFTFPFLNILLFATLLLSCCCRNVEHCSVVHNDDFFNNFLACLAEIMIYTLSSL